MLQFQMSLMWHLVVGRFAPSNQMRRCGEIGRRMGLKIPGGNTRIGSSPITGTNAKRSGFVRSFLRSVVRLEHKEVMRAQIIIKSMLR